MFRTKDFNFMNVLRTDGKSLGFINDVLIDIPQKKIIGFRISTHNIFSKFCSVFISDIISFNDYMIAAKASNRDIFCFSSIRNMDVKDNFGNNIGIIEDLVFSDIDFSICAVIISTGFLNNFLNGKIIALLDNLIIGDKSILYIDRCEKVSLRSVPHKLNLEVDRYEDNKRNIKESN